MSNMEHVTPEDFDAEFAAITAGFGDISSDIDAEFAVIAESYGDSLPDAAAEERRTAKDRAGRRIADALFCAPMPPEFVDFTLERWSGHLGVPRADLERTVSRAIITESVLLRTATYGS